MEKDAYIWNIEMCEKHWWFRARNEIIKFLIQKNIGDSSGLKILDAGCGTGTNIKMLQGFGDVSAIEPSEIVIEYARDNNPKCDIRQGLLPDSNPFINERFNLVTSLDVIEHIENDVEVLKHFKSILSDNGNLILTVPAFPSIFSYADTSAHHFRRYSKKELKKKLINAGFEKFDIYYFNTFLFIPIYSLRLFQKIFNFNVKAEDNVPNPVLNKLFFTLMNFEKYLLKYNPFGISLCVIAKNN